MKKKQARSLDDVVLPPWKAVVFGDLHVSAKTLDRCLEVLKRVRELAHTHQAMVICTGDFWHQRGVLNVRQMDALLDELEQWRGIEFVIIPGNHDQVSQCGMIHGVRVFGAFPNITVATEPLLWHQSRIAFLPWREEPGAQAALFGQLMDGGGPWTVFAHAEVAGATTNGLHITPGRVGLSEIEAVASACYCGHYHKRQKLGERTWYLGSPFEMNFGERDMPHGVALIEEGRAEPHFIDFDDMPKHHRLVWGQSTPAPTTIAPHDIVEVHAPPDVLGTERMAQLIQTIPADDVRTLVTVEEDSDEVPSIAMGLDEAVHRWIEDSDGTDLDRFRLRQLGQTILSEIPEARGIQPLSPEVDILDVSVKNFCGIRGHYVFTFEDGVTLIKGAMGAGKTSLMDALTWAFFGTTTPRKAGSHGASLRADEVIHDDAAGCEVQVTVELQGHKKPISVTRTKKRGVGSKAKITGVQAPEGIADQQQLIDSVLGINHALWRTCVYLGQGAVGNFVTDADKQRKDLLSTAFGLDACPPAQKYARDRIKEVDAHRERLKLQMHSDARAIEVLQETDYKEQIALWDEQKKAALEAITADGESAKEAVAACDHHLKTEAGWLESRQQHTDAIDQLTKSLVQAAPKNKDAELQQQFGAIRAERSIVERDQALAREELRKHAQAMESGTSVCPTCERPFDMAHQEQHQLMLENKVQSFTTTLQSFDVRLSDLTVKMGSEEKPDNSRAEGIEAQIKESRAALDQCGEALNTLAVIKSNRVTAEQRLHSARAQYLQKEREVNPFMAKQVECESKVATLQSKQAADRVEMDSLEEKHQDLSFWEKGFGARGLPVLVLRAALHELESYANAFMNQLTRGRIYVTLLMKGEELKISFFEVDPQTKKVHERRYEALSGGQRRCVELAFNPFALGEMVFNRCGVRVNTLIVDELTTHLGQDEKPIVCDILRSLNRRSVVVIDHDMSVQSEFDQVFDLDVMLNGIPKAEVA